MQRVLENFLRNKLDYARRDKGGSVSPLFKLTYSSALLSPLFPATHTYVHLPTQLYRRTSDLAISRFLGTSARLSLSLGRWRLIGARKWRH